jgi:hypothetical protein
MKSIQAWNHVLSSVVILASCSIGTSRVLAEEAYSYGSLAGDAKAVDTTQPTNVHLTPLIQTDDDTKKASEGQVTSVTQLSDVQPTDWAFQALQSLVERYGCIAGYPDGTFKGQRAATRYELAAALNACLDQVSDRFATKEDLEAAKALQEEFNTELATVKGKTDGLEARTATLEAQAFSTTTKLKGEAIFAAGYVVDEIPSIVDDVDVGDDDRIFAGDRVRLTFDTSFDGKDRLRTRLEAGNIPDLEISGANNRQVRLGFAADTGNEFVLDELNYQFNVTEKLRIKVDANAGEFQDNVDTFNPYLESSGTGALSRFGRFNPIYRLGGGDGAAGVTVTYKPTDELTLEVGYLGEFAPFTAADTDNGQSGGLFGGTYAAIAQIGYSPSFLPKTRVGLTYVHAFDETGTVNVTSSTTGTSPSRRPFGNNNTQANHLGFQFTTQPASFINLSGWFGYTFAGNKSEDILDPQRVEIRNWAVSAQFPDLLRRGNLGYILVGQAPRIVNAFGVGLDYDDIEPGIQTSEPQQNWHFEVGYKLNINGNITITPGVIVILNAENGAIQNRFGADDTVIVPVVRTTFTF